MTDPTGWQPLHSPEEDTSYFNWGQLNGSQRALQVADTLTGAHLSREDVELIVSLRLDPKRHSPQFCAEFQEFVSALTYVTGAVADSDTRTFGSELGTEWIKELLVRYATYRWDRSSRSIIDQAKDYAEGNHEVPLLILHLLMLRSDFWLHRLCSSTGGGVEVLRELWNLPDEDISANFHQLVGDPFNLPPELAPNEWGTAVFSRRWARLVGHVPEFLQPLMNDLDLLTHIAAVAHPDLWEYITAYDRWAEEARLN